MTSQSRIPRLALYDAGRLFADRSNRASLDAVLARWRRSDAQGYYCDKRLLLTAWQPVTVLTGLTVNHCVSTTPRMPSILGFETYLVSDTTATFQRSHLHGPRRSGEEAHLAKLSDIHDEFATVVNIDEVLATCAADAVCRAEPVIK